MKIEDQVCSPQQAIRIKELGIEQKSYFYHTVLLDVIHLEYLPMNPADRIDIVGSAFNVAELGVMVPSLRTFENKGETEAQGRAAWIIHLLEKGIITADKINARLK